MDNSESQDELAIIVENVEITLFLKYANFAVLTFLIYDTVILFDDEVKYFMQPRKKALSYLYFVTRYSGILFTVLGLILDSSNATTKICDLSYLSGFLEPLLVLCVDYILLLRVRALYSKERNVTIFLTVAFSMEAISLTALGSQGIIVQHSRPINIAPGLTYCSITTPSFVESVISWVIPIVYGIMLMILAVYRSAKILKEEPGLTTVKIIKIIVRDQVVYFMALILISAGTILSDVLPFSIPVLIVEEAFGNPAILSSVGARLLLNMKKAGAKGLNEGMGSSASKATVSGMDFAAPPAQVASRSVALSAENAEWEAGEIESIQA